MQCTIPVTLFNLGVLLQELAPAIILFICAIGLAFHGGLAPRKKAAAIAILCMIGAATSASTAMLALRSKIVVEGDTSTLQAGFWKAELPTVALVGIGATEPVGDSLGKRRNGMSSRGVNVGWFEDPGGRRVFALSAGRSPVLLPISGGFSVVLDQSTVDDLLQCDRRTPAR